MKEIVLHTGAIALVDDEDYERLAVFRWYESKRSNGNSYAHSAKKIDGKTHNFYMHRMVVDYPRVDHINGNGLDNRKENLRPCTQQQNIRNQTRRRGGASEYKGVHYVNRPGLTKKWQSQITINGRAKYLGYFMTEEEAALAYDAKAVELFGEFAHLNFPQHRDKWE